MLSNKKLEDEEEEFSYRQAKLRSKIRLKEKRAKPLDIILYSLSFIEKQEKFSLTNDTSRQFAIYEKEEYKILFDLKMEELQEMKEDIKLYSAYDEYRDFWQALLNLCEHQIRILNGKVDNSFIHKEILEEILSEMKTKTHKELVELETDVKWNLSNNDIGLDMEFWEIILKEIEISKSKALLDSYHQKIVKAFTEEMKTSDKKEPIESQLDKSSKNVSLITKTSLDEKEMLKRVASYEQPGDFYFANEVPVDVVYSWAKDVQPIKPKYSNRSCFGTDYVKLKEYYDTETPPEKYIIGYKFHIFYPNLINPQMIPTFQIEDQPENVEKVTIRFCGSPPYTDIAFRVQNKEWDRSPKSV